MSLTRQIKQKALELGFDLAGITDAAPLDAAEVDHFTQWLKAGFAADMLYMHRNLKKRINPAELLKNANSVICVALNYNRLKPSSPSPGSNLGRIAGYAQYEDYHLFIKKLLRELAVFLASVAPNLKFRICVDSVPFAERAFAARAGLGFIGRNHMLINSRFGPQLLLGEIITNLELKPDKPLTQTCTRCAKCIDACPTNALRNDGCFNVRRCISYLTIEHTGNIPPDLAAKIGNRLFGCDECVLACPFLKNAPSCANTGFRFYPERAAVDLQSILDMSTGQFEARFADSVIRRLGLEQLKANARIVLKNITGRQGWGSALI